MTAVAEAVPHPAKKAARLTVAAYLTAQIELCGKQQLQLAKECNFAKANIITMIKQGNTKLPMSKIGLMAKALGLDPFHLYKMVMQEYDPNNWAAIEDCLSRQVVLTESEIEVIMTLRETGVMNFKMHGVEDRVALQNLIHQWDITPVPEETDADASPKETNTDAPGQIDSSAH